MAAVRRSSSMKRRAQPAYVGPNGQAAAMDGLGTDPDGLDGGMGDEGPVEAPRRLSVGRSLESDAPADVMMEFVVEKLKLLNYERDFCRRKRPHWTPLTKTYFALPSNNQNEQFFYFTSLVAWLLNLSGRNIQTPGQFDDPNATCANLLMELQNLGFAPPSFPPAKLKQGHGEAVCGVLDNLASFAMEKQRFTFKQPLHAPDLYPDEAEVDDLGDGAADIIDETTMPSLTEEDESLVEAGPESPSSAADREATGVLESRVDPAEWKLELERVGPQLRVTMVADVKDWRTHLDQAKQYHEEIGKSLPESKSQLERVEADVAAALEKLGTRENHVNRQFVELTQEYRAKRDILAEKQEGYNKSMDSVAKLTDELARITERLETIKQTMDERGNDISDASPLVKIKSAIQRLKKELTQMEVRIGVVEHTLLQVSLKQREKSTMATNHQTSLYDYSLG